MEDVDGGRFVQVARLADLDSGVPHPVVVQGTQIVLLRDGDRVHALADRCTHAACALSEGVVMDDVLICPCHGSEFRVATGEVLSPPARRDVATYPVSLTDDVVAVRLPDEPATR